MNKFLNIRRLLLIALLACAVFAQDGSYEDTTVVDMDELLEQDLQEPVVVQEEPVAAKVPKEEPPVVVKEQVPPLVKEQASLPKPVTELIQMAKDTAAQALDKIKSLSKKDVKKAAAAALGVWGVSVAVGWLAQTSSHHKPTTAAFVSKAKGKK
jgi:hypothetical protein